MSCVVDSKRVLPSAPGDEDCWPGAPTCIYTLGFFLPPPTYIPESGSLVLFCCSLQDTHIYCLRHAPLPTSCCSYTFKGLYDYSYMMWKESDEGQVRSQGYAGRTKPGTRLDLLTPNPALLSASASLCTHSGFTSFLSHLSLSSPTISIVHILFLIMIHFLITPSLSFLSNRFSSYWILREGWTFGKEF